MARHQTASRFKLLYAMEVEEIKDGFLRTRDLTKEAKGSILEMEDTIQAMEGSILAMEDLIQDPGDAASSKVSNAAVNSASKCVSKSPEEFL
jgi:hypothetical protein